MCHQIHGVYDFERGGSLGVGGRSSRLQVCFSGGILLDTFDIQVVSYDGTQPALGGRSAPSFGAVDVVSDVDGK